MKFRFIFSLLAAIGLFTLIANPATAASDEDAIKQRKAVMKAVGGTMGGLKAVVQGKAPMSQAAALGNAMSQFASITGQLFPEGSDFGDTRAKEEIWAKPAEFKAAVMAFEKAAANIAKVAASGDAGAMKGAFGGLGKSCGGCHKPFRKPKN